MPRRREPMSRPSSGARCRAFADTVNRHLQPSVRFLEQSPPTPDDRHFGWAAVPPLPPRSRDHTSERARSTSSPWPTYLSLPHSMKPDHSLRPVSCASSSTVSPVRSIWPTRPQPR